MKNKLLIILLFIGFFANAQWLKNIFEYSTPFFSYNETNPLTTDEQYFVTQSGDVINVTPERSNDYLMTFGIRKLARFDYENKARKWYDGTEQNTSLSSNSGSVVGLEYLFQKSFGRQRNMEYKSHRYFLRYLKKYWSIKIESQKNGIINLNYDAADLRFRLPITKNLNFSFGGIVRTHNSYGYNPITEYLKTNQWWDLAYEYDYYDTPYGIDNDLDGENDVYDWYWYNSNDNQVADTDADFRRNVYQRIVNDYNKRELDKIGTLYTLSAVVGLDYYYYRDKFWLHSWANLMPKHHHLKGDYKYSYENFIGRDDWLDYNVGIMSGLYLIKNKIGIFIEYERTKFWDKNLIFLKTGVNIML